MTKITKYKPGEFCWADLGATDVPKAKKFYASVLGWESVDEPNGPEGNDYTRLRIDEKDICGLYPMIAEMRMMKIPPFWLPFISVANVDRTVKKATAAGGVLRMGPMDVPNAGRMAVLGDPTGAGFAIWQARGQKGTQLKELPGTVCWHDLNTPDRAAAGKFYAKVFGWKVETQDFSGNPYYLFKLPGKRNGIGGMWPQPMPESPPAWFTYWVVESCAKAAAKTKRLGGKVLLGPITVPQTCTFAILQDPQGAAFGALEPLI
jgi:predicted enzyme related to lactoylglutathione lyase